MSSQSMLVFDVLLLLSLTGLAAAALAGTDARRSIILFIAFGLLLAVAWGRLQAPDVALAEAAIGAGLSGALLLAALRRQPRKTSGAHADRNPHTTGATAMLPWSVTLLCAALAGMLAWALGHALGNPPGDTLPRAIAANLATSGVSNPVTAVLLNFRAYDTLLELAVLLTAVLGILALGRSTPGYQPAGPVFDGLAHWLVPVLIVMAGYLLWTGAHAPGGAFQAGAMLAAAGVVLRLAGRTRIGLPNGISQRALLAAGVAMFLLVGLAQVALGRPFLAYPPAWAGAQILLIETAAMLAIAATLLLAFVGGRTTTTAASTRGGTSGADKRTAQEHKPC
ncbi:MAG: hydrogenase subunit MbhD domain-containing protein [Pseudomonadota bacterium]